MADISNLNVHVNQNQIGQNQVGRNPLDAGTIQSGQNAAQSAQTGEQKQQGFRSGTLVEGRVLSQNADGTYTVRLEGQGGQPAQVMNARATINLLVGENFRAVWDSSGEIPVLRLSQNELSLLARMPAGDRELATSLLSRGMPLSGEVIGAIRESWRRMGGKTEQLSSLLELWARDIPMTSENVQTLAWYMSLTGADVNAIWARIRAKLKERLGKGENPVDILKDLKEGDEEIALFLKGHSLLLRSPRDDVNPALLGGPVWPNDDPSHVMARVFVGMVREDGDRRYWQMGFTVEGARLGFIGGDVESDGRSYNLNLYAERRDTCDLLKHKRHAIRKELEDVPLVLQFVGISQAVSGAMREQLLSGRGMDITV
ncbi:flagellar hook-length control protein FliK [Synergistales bacterium]|nr:flagellar hook-length control protein FliK [Synergistales bacterium]